MRLRLNLMLPLQQCWFAEAVLTNVLLRQQSRFIRIGLAKSAWVNVYTFNACIFLLREYFVQVYIRLYTNCFPYEACDFS